MSRTQVKSKPKSKGADSPHHRASQDAAGGYSVFCAPSSRLGAFYSAGPVFGLGATIQAKVAIGRTNDPYEREADAVADRVTTGGQAPSISLIPTSGLNGIAQRQIEDEEQPEDLTPIQTPLQRQETEEEEEPGETTSIQTLIQRQATEKEEEEQEEPPLVQTFVQRQETEEEVEPEETTSIQPLIQRQETEEEVEPEEPTPVQTFVQRQKTEDEEQPEETLAQTKWVQRQATDDEYEDETDQVAGRVMRMPEPAALDDEQTTLQAKPIDQQITSLAGPQVQTKCTECETEDQIQAKMSFPVIPDVTKESSEGEAEAGSAREEEAETPSGDEAADAAKGKSSDTKVSLPTIEPLSQEEEVPPIQTQSLGTSNGQTSNPPAAQRQNGTSLQDALRNSKGGGSPMPPAVQSEMEPYFGRDLSQVHVHTDSTSVQMNRALSARAFTHEQNIYFNAGEYPPTSRSGKHLLAHELTHTIQQGAVRDTVIQRYSAPEQDITTEPKPERPNDGAEVEGRMNEKINNDPNVKDPEDLSEEERKEAQNPNREKVRQESNEISSSGESKPPVDRGAAAQQKTEAQKAQIGTELQEQPPEASEEEAEGEEEASELSEAEAAAQRAQAAEQQAHAVPIPVQPEPFRHPRIEAPVDSAGEPLPRNSQIDTQVRGLGYIGEMLRQKGYEMKRYAAEQKIGSYGLDAVLEKQREDLANAKEGTATMETHNKARQEIAQQSREAHGESVERQQFVAEKAPDLASKADEGQADSGELASEARSKADRSQSEIPDDEDARGDAEQQSSEMQDTAQGAASMDQAIRQTSERARQYQQDAAAAAEQNQQSEAQIAETEEVTSQTEARITDMHATNEASQAKIENAGPGPALIRQHAQQTAQSGDQLIAATVVMEQELNALQEEYLAGHRAIESREAAIERQQREQEQAGQAEMSPEQQQLFELAGMNDEEQEQRIAEMEQPQRDSLLRTLNEMIQRAPDQGTAETEGARLKVDTGLSQAIMGEQPADPRAPQIQEVENRRIQRVGGVLDIADQNMTFLTVQQQQMLANRLVAESITDDIKNINVLQMAKDMLTGMIDPRQSLTSVVGGFEKMLTGVANIGNWEAWQRDPLGNLLQIAADITTGLAMIFSTILGIATVITAIMVALIIITWGFAAVTASPVIAWMGSLISFAGWGAIIAGSLSVLFNYLSYIKNLHDAGTAETARELFGNTEQMKQNATDGFQGAMAVVEGIGAVKMGPKLSSGQIWENFPRTPGQWASQTVQGARQGLRTIAGAPAAVARGARKLFQGGRRGLLRFKERIRGFFGRRRPGRPGDVDLDVDTPQARQRRQTQLDEARGKRVRDMDDAEFRTEMREVGDNRPRRIEPGSEHFDSYDIEIEANDHTYRRRRDGKGWCRFSSAEECGIPDDALPPEARRQADILEIYQEFQERSRASGEVDLDRVENLDDVIDKPKGAPPTEAGVKGDIGEARHIAEITGEGTLPPTARQHAGRHRLRELKDQLELERSMSIREFAETFPEGGVRQMRLRTSRGVRVVDHMFIEGDNVILRESKNIRKLDLAGDTQTAQKLRTQIDKDLELVDLYDEAIVEWRIDGQINAETKPILQQLIDENNGRFRVNPSSLLD
ncbi:MAG: DUF4157 domain-containing protein [Gammaproteobacteria bacterium]|nr:DUF4157 domain-containing protein [Gammaproteobacteria bacterium]